MAAILCGGVGKCIEGACNCTCSICKESCQLCGECRKGMNDACRSIGACCDEICCSPFCLAVTVALVFNVPTIALGITEVTSRCRGSLWLLISIVLCLINIAAAVYVACRINNRDDPRLEDRLTVCSRATYLFCYDPCMAVYLLILVGFFVWLLVGIAWNTSGIATQDCEANDADAIEDKISIAVGFGLAYYVFGSFAFLCSCCCTQQCKK